MKYRLSVVALVIVCLFHAPEKEEFATEAID